MRERLQHFINGLWVDSDGGRRHVVTNPATEEPCAAIMLASQTDVDKAVAAARAAFAHFSRTSPDERLALLERIVAAYKQRIPDLALAMAEEMGAPITFASTAQTGAGIGGFASTIAALRQFNFREDHGAYAVAWEPVGVVGMITPWNWPLNQIALKVAPALAAGNTIVLKPSEECPTCAAIFAEVLDTAGVPPGVFNLVQGDGPGAGAAIAAHRDIDMVSFTGSTRAGILVAKAAADTVKRVHQELGGKSPNLVLPDADFGAYLAATASGPLVNSGQSCISPTRILVPREREAEAAAFVGALYAKATVGDPLEPGGHLGPLVNKAQFDKVRDLIQSAIDEGAKLETGGPELPGSVNRGYYIQPTVFSGVTPAMRVAQEEIFGPVATLIAYDSLEDAVAIANDTAYGLSACVTGDPVQAAQIVPLLRAGIVGINTASPTGGAPFGGYKQSGNGREGGLFGLKDFMEVKAITGLPV